MRHINYVAMHIMNISFSNQVVGAYHGAAQAVALLSRFELTGFVVSVSALPSGVCGVIAPVMHLQDVVHGIVYIMFMETSHSLAVVG